MRNMKEKLLYKRMKTLYYAGLWLCMSVLCVNFASCSDDFDDSEIIDRLDKVENRVTALEKSLTDQINSLQALINGKLTVSSWTFDEEAGCYKVLLSDGSSFEVVKAGEDNSTPIIGVAQDENGAYYWTSDGEPLLNAKGEKIYLESTVAPSVRVNPTSGEWEISPDGGVTYLPTGIKAGDNVSLIAKVRDDKGYVYFTLSDGTEIKVAKTADFKIALLAGKQYFKYGQTRTVGLEMSGVKKKAVFSKPDGWKASIIDDELSITAPVETNELAEKSGSVIVQAWFDDGTSDISEVAVVIGNAPHEITVDSDMNISFSTSSELNANEQWIGMAKGVVRYDEFSLEQITEDIKGNTRLEWSRETDSFKLGDLLGSEPVKGESYVVWCIDKFDNYGYDSYGDVLYTVVVVPDLKFEVSDVTFEDATISVIAKGISKYYGGVAEAEGYEDQISYILDDINSPWGASQVPVEGSYNGLLSKYAPAWEGAVNELKAGKTYIVYAIPFADGKEYTKDDVYSVEVAIKKITTGGSAVVTVGDVNTTMTSVEATVTKGNGTYKYWAVYISDEDLKNYDTDEKIIEYLTGKGSAFDMEEYKVENSNLTPEVKGWIVAVGVDRNGVAGTVVRKEANTTSLTYSEITLPEPTLTVGLKDVTIEFPATSGIKQYKYIDMTLQEWNNHWLFGKDTDGDGMNDAGDESLTEGKLALRTVTDYMTYYFQDAESDGSVTLNLTGRNSGAEYVLFVMGVDEKGNPTHMKRVNYTPGIDATKFVKADDGKYRPIELKNIKIDNQSIETFDEEQLGNLSGFRNFSCEVTLPENCKKWWVYIDSDEFLSGAGVGARAKTGFIVSFYGTEEKEPTEIEIESEYFNSDKNIYLVWQDNDGNYYQYQEIKPKDLKKQ